MLYKEEVFQLVGLCMEIYRELGKGHDEVIYKDALVVELTRAEIPFSREKNYKITYKGVVLHGISLLVYAERGEAGASPAGPHTPMLPGRVCGTGASEAT
jgi:hypothetical protein